MQKMTTTLWLFAGTCSLILIILTGCKLTRAGYESASYSLVRKVGPFEIRDYPPLTLVSTPMATASKAEDESFMRLFRYISGANQSETKIAMTTPVFTAMAGTNRQMSFVVPKKIAATGAPNAKRDDIKVVARHGGRFAVYRFSGSSDKSRAEQSARQLTEWLAAEKIQTVGATELANYDPPFTPPFARRNEVMVRVLNPDNQSNH